MINKFNLFTSQLYMKYLRLRFRKYVYWGSPVRNFLELELLPFFRVDDAFQKILFVGLHKYTVHYHSYFNNKKEIKTIDIDPAQKEFADESIHIVDSITNIDNYIKNDYLDLVLMNGVYGWGLNAESDLVTALHKIHSILRPGGVVLFGWNDVPQYDPLQINKSNYFKNFEPFLINGKSEIFITDQNPKRHIFRFYQKPLIEK